MAGHFQAIGVDDVRAFMDHAIPLGDWHPMADGGRSMVWRDPSGASLAAWSNPENALVTAAPSFDASCRAPISEATVVEGFEPEFDATVIVQVLEDGEDAFPLPLQLEDVHHLLRGGTTTARELSLTAFFEEIVEVWESESAFGAHAAAEYEASGIPPLGGRSLIPTGLFFDRPHEQDEELPLPEPRALITGCVLSADTLVNSVTGNPFVHASIATAAVTLDCVVAPVDLEHELAPGMVVRAGCWLIGRLRES